MSSKIIINIKGQDWKVELLGELTFIKKYGECSAITNTEDRAIYVNKSCLTPGTLRHEILHALMAEAHVESANLDANQVEEICCTIVDFMWYNIGKWVDEIMVEFLKPKKAKEFSKKRKV